MKYFAIMGWGILAVVLQGVCEAARPNVVLFVTDDQSADIGAYGNRVIKTPHMDALARDGVIFQSAFCTTASCSASRSVILSGLHNHLNGQYGHQHSYHHFSSFERVRSLPVRLTEAGYHTVRIGKYHVAPEDVYQFDVELPGNSRNPVVMAENFDQHLGELSGEQPPFFLYFCTSDPHRGGGQRSDLENAPNAFGNRQEGYPGVQSVHYNPEDIEVPDFLPDSPTCRAELAMYYESVSRIDQGLGKLIEVLQSRGLYDNTIVIFTSDHGMAFPGAKTNLYEPGMRVPMIVRNPHSTARGRTTPAMVSHVDLAPTILDWAEAYGASTPNKPEDFHGRSWASVLDQENPADWDTVYGSHTFHEIQMYYPMRVVRQRQYKLIWNIAHPLSFPFASDLWAAPTWQERYQQGTNALYGKRTVSRYMHRPQFELYDLAADPHEVTNLADAPEHAQLMGQLIDELKRFQKDTEDPWIMKWDYE